MCEKTQIQVHTHCLEKTEVNRKPTLHKIKEEVLNWDVCDGEYEGDSNIDLFCLLNVLMNKTMRNSVMHTHAHRLTLAHPLHLHWKTSMGDRLCAVAYIHKFTYVFKTWILLEQSRL